MVTPMARLIILPRPTIKLIEALTIKCYRPAKFTTITTKQAKKSSISLLLNLSWFFSLSILLD